jgi:hypothetical protein
LGKWIYIISKEIKLKKLKYAINKNPAIHLYSLDSALYSHTTTPIYIYSMAPRRAIGIFSAREIG